MIDIKTEEEEYNKILFESNLFHYGATKGSYILPPRGYSLWENIRKILDGKFSKRGIKNVILPTLIPIELLSKEKEHVSGFTPEFFQVERIGEKKIDNPLILRPTSEVIFYDWYRKIIQTYQQLPLLYNQWCSVFRAEKNTSPFFRNTEFLWQEGHTIHSNEEEAKKITLDILSDYYDYACNYLQLNAISGRKTEKEKFAGAIETYTIECLLPDGQCLQLATSHYFGDKFCKFMNVRFQNRNNNWQNPFSTSWGTSTRSIGALVKTHADSLGAIFPFEVAPVQIAFIVIGEEKEVMDYYKEVNEMFSSKFRCELYNRNKQVSSNILQADKEGCPFKIIIGKRDLEEKKLVFSRRDDVRKKIAIEKEKSMLFIEKEIVGFNNELKRRVSTFYKKKIFEVENYANLMKMIDNGTKGLFLVPFCNNLDCEIENRNKVPSYTFRCISEKKPNQNLQCLFCEKISTVIAYLGRSY